MQRKRLQMITLGANRMTALRIILSVTFLSLSTLLFGQGAARANQSPTLCKVESLPSDIQNRLKEEYGSWKIQEPADLSQRARERWESEKPQECPGIAVGHFERDRKSTRLNSSH